MATRNDAAFPRYCLALNCGGPSNSPKLIEAIGRLCCGYRIGGLTLQHLERRFIVAGAGRRAAFITITSNYKAVRCPTTRIL